MLALLSLNKKSSLVSLDDKDALLMEGDPEESVITPDVGGERAGDVVRTGVLMVETRLEGGKDDVPDVVGAVGVAAVVAVGAVAI